MNLLPLLKKPEGAVSFLAFGCSHAPLQDEASLEVVRERISEWKPDRVIHLGDLHEADSASRWPSEYSWTIEDEFATANEKVLKPIRLANSNPAAEYVLLQGNHDANILAIDRIDAKVRGRCDYTIRQYNKDDRWLNEELLTHWKRPCKYEYSRTNGVYRIGAVVFGHGYECGASSDEVQSISLGWPYGLFVSAHTHRPTPGEPIRAMKTKTLPLDRWYLNAGCTRDIWNVPFMERKRRMQWGTAVVYGWAFPITSPRFTTTWEAYCESIRTFEEHR